jgi:two-component system chemotaxis response regulator CheB
MAERIRVLVVDDSAMMRRMIKGILDTASEIEVVGMARDGQDAIEKDRQLSPDVITMDINMPSMDGMTAMLHIFQQHPAAAVVMLSSLTQEGAMATFEALELGAFDYVAKPSGTVSSNLYIVGKELIAKIKAANQYGQKIRRRVRIKDGRSSSETPATSAARSSVGRGKTSDNATISRIPTRVIPISPAVPAPLSDVARIAVVIGVSTGGPSTLMEILPKLPIDLNATLLIVQHMPAAFTASFARRLGDNCNIPFTEAGAGDRLLIRNGLVAPGGIHMVVRRNPARGEGVIRLTSQPDDTLFIPSVNVTMNSALDFFGQKTVGVLLTGMGDDGADAMVNVRRAGGITIAEDESTAVVFGMPREAIERGGASIVAPAHRIAGEIVRAVAKLS